MKKLTTLFLFFIFLLILPVPIFAAVLEKNEHVVLEKNEVINEDYFATGEAVTLSGTVNGDAYVAAGKVLVDGTINGDLLVAGGNVQIRGNVKNDVRAAGGSITVSAPIGGNLTVAGGNVEVTDSATVSGSLTAGAGSLSIFGPVGKGATICGGDVTFGNTIGNNVNAGIGKLTLTSAAKINGDLNYWSEKQAQIAQDASVSGALTYHPSSDSYDASKAIGEAAAGVGMAVKLFEAITALIIGALIIRFTPFYTKRILDTSLTKPWASLGIGFAAIILTPILVGVLFVTILGIPLAVILLFMYLIELYIAKIFTSILIGQKLLELLKQNGNMYMALIVGIIAGIVLMFIPIIGWFVLLVTYLIAFGALVIAKKDFYRELREKKLI